MTSFDRVSCVADIHARVVIILLWCLMVCKLKQHMSAAYFVAKQLCSEESISLQPIGCFVHMAWQNAWPYQIACGITPVQILYSIPAFCLHTLHE